MKTLADQLRRAVNECEWSLNSIAKEAGIPQPVLWRFVNGERVCRCFHPRVALFDAARRPTLVAGIWLLTSLTCVGVSLRRTFHDIRFVLWAM